MVNAPKRNLLPLCAGKYGKSTKHSTRRCHRANEGMSSLEAELVWAGGALRSLRSTKKLAAGKRRETHVSSNREKEKWIKDYVDRETTVTRLWVEDAGTAIKQKQDISKKKFDSGGMAPSGWTCSVRAVRDTPVADCSAPGVNSTRRVVYRPPISLSLSLRVLSFSHCKRSLSRCGQLWQYVEMGSLGTRLHRDCNAMGDAANISPRVPSTCAQNTFLSLPIIHIIPSRQIYVAIDNPSLVPSVSCLTTSSYLWNYVCAADNISPAANLQTNG